MTPSRNPGGIRFGSSEIYDVLDFAFSKSTGAQHLLDFLAVGQKVDNGTDERVILFVKLSEDEHLSLDLESNIKAAIRERRSPRHVPSRVSAARRLPRRAPDNGFVDYTSARYPIYPQWQARGGASEEGQSALQNADFLQVLLTYFLARSSTVHPFRA